MKWNSELIRNVIKEELFDLLYVKECYEILGNPALIVEMNNGQRFRILIEDC